MGLSLLAEISTTFAPQAGASLKQQLRSVTFLRSSRIRGYLQLPQWQQHNDGTKAVWTKAPGTVRSTPS